MLNIVKQEKICIKKFCRHCQLNSIITMYSCVCSQFALLGCATEHCYLIPRLASLLFKYALDAIAKRKIVGIIRFRLWINPYTIWRCEMVISNCTVDKWMKTPTPNAGKKIMQKVASNRQTKCLLHRQHTFDAVIRAKHYYFNEIFCNGNRNGRANGISDVNGEMMLMLRFRTFRMLLFFFVFFFSFGCC